MQEKTKAMKMAKEDKLDHALYGWFRRKGLTVYVILHPNITLGYPDYLSVSGEVRTMDNGACTVLMVSQKSVASAE